MTVGRNENQTKILDASKTVESPTLRVLSVNEPRQSLEDPAELQFQLDEDLEAEEPGYGSRFKY